MRVPRLASTICRPGSPVFVGSASVSHATTPPENEMLGFWLSPTGPIGFRSDGSLYGWTVTIWVPVPLGMAMTIVVRPSAGSRGRSVSPLEVYRRISGSGDDGERRREGASEEQAEEDDATGAFHGIPKRVPACELRASDIPYLG
jgi:hypothetical protein